MAFFFRPDGVSEKKTTSSRRDGSYCSALAKFMLLDLSSLSMVSMILYFGLHSHCINYQ